MTRRPPMPPDGNIRRAHQRMAPGGRLWSESPVKGPAVRVVAAGDDPPPAADPVWVGIGWNAGGTDQAAITWNARDAGDILLATCSATGATCDPPPGWTEIAGGSLGDDGSWSVAWGVSAGGAVDTTEGAFTVAATGQRSMIRGEIIRGAGALTPQLIGPVVTAGPAATSITFPGVGSAVLPVQHAVLCADEPGAFAVGWEIVLTPTAAVTTFKYSNDEGYPGIVGTLPAQTPEWAEGGVVSGPFPTTTSASLERLDVAEPSSYAAFSIGWGAP